jgi:hypothetical protein
MRRKSNACNNRRKKWTIIGENRSGHFLEWVAIERWRWSGADRELHGATVLVEISKSASPLILVARHNYVVLHSCSSVWMSSELWARIKSFKISQLSIYVIDSANNMKAEHL